MPTERYRHGPLSDWVGYVLYDRRKQQYVHVAPGMGPNKPQNLLSEDLESFIQSGHWMVDTPPDQLLPEGF